MTTETAFERGASVTQAIAKLLAADNALPLSAAIEHRDNVQRQLDATRAAQKTIEDAVNEIGKSINANAAEFQGAKLVHEAFLAGTLAEMPPTSKAIRDIALVVGEMLTDAGTKLDALSEQAASLEADLAAAELEVKERAARPHAEFVDGMH